MLPQRPLAPPVFEALHALQAPEQAFSQHTPSTQKFELHSALLAQIAPSASLPQAPTPLQTVEPTHSLSGSVLPAIGAHVPFGWPVLVLPQA